MRYVLWPICPWSWACYGSSRAGRSSIRCARRIPRMLCPVGGGWKPWCWPFWTGILPSRRWANAWTSVACSPCSKQVSGGNPSTIPAEARSSRRCLLPTCTRCVAPWHSKPSASLPGRGCGSIRLRPRFDSMGRMTGSQSAGGRPGAWPTRSTSGPWLEQRWTPRPPAGVAESGGAW